MISSCEKWNTKDGNFNLRSFYNNIVSIFKKHPQDDFVVETLEWWNKQVPGLAPTNKQKQGQRQQDGADDSSDDEVVKEMLSLFGKPRAQK
ncbi:hypothetical protein H0H87_001956, partial [Tephrocybe sp. NHM501043]